MSREIIAIDIDDVLSSQTEVLIEFSNNRYGTSLTMDHFQEPGEYWTYYEKVLANYGVKAEEAGRRFQEFLDEKHPLTQVIESEVRAALDLLKRSYQLDIVTSRGADWKAGTIDWLTKHAPNIFDGVHFVDLWSTPDTRATKGQICKEIGAGYLIDDNVSHCNIASELGVQALLFGNYGWNVTGTVHPYVVRVAGWQEVLEYFTSDRN